MVKFAAIILGGGAGAVFRYLLAGLVSKWSDSIFPWGTLSVNLLGSFIIGLIWGISEQLTIPPNLKIFIFIGVLGGFTTFSSYNLENFHLLRDGETIYAVINIMISNVVGIALVFSGFALSRFLFK